MTSIDDFWDDLKNGKETTFTLSWKVEEGQDAFLDMCYGATNRNYITKKNRQKWK